MPPLSPMLAKPAPEIPQGDYLYEPKWDGFRCILFRDGGDVVLGSRNERPLTRYFPEIVDAARVQLPERIVIDCEIVVEHGGRLQFEALQHRIHPADSRVRMLAEATPARIVAFDLLALGGDSLLERPFAERRAALDRALAASAAPVHLTPATRDVDLARRWFVELEAAGIDGILAKPLTGNYQPGVRAMTKVKHARTADCVVAGFRWHKSGDVLGSLMLGLYAADGRLQSVGVAAAFSAARRAELVEELTPYRATDLASHPWGEWADPEAHASARLPGGVSRWNSGKDLSFVPLRPELVVEVGYDAMEGTRFRHTAQFKRWRPDRDPTSCTYDQLERPGAADLWEILTR